MLNYFSKDNVLHDQRQSTIVFGLFLMMSAVVIGWASYEIWVTPSWDFIPNWYQDYTLQIRTVPVSSPLHEQLEVGDLVQTVDGVRIRPGYIPLERKTSYDFVVERNGVLTTVEVPSQLTPSWVDLASRTPIITNSLISFVLGVLILIVFRSSSLYGDHIGMILVLLGIQGVGLQGWLQGGSYLWFLGVPLTILCTPCLVYLGYLPRHNKLTKPAKAHIMVFVVCGLLLLSLSVYERIVLMPNRSFVQEFGFSTYRAGLGFITISLLSCNLTVLMRVLKAPSLKQKHDLKILFYFLTLASLPAVFFTFLPRVFLEAYLLPFPVAICLTELSAIGFFYIHYKANSFRLDNMVSRFLTWVLLIIVGITFTSYVIYIAGQSVRLDQSSASFIVILAMVLCMVLYRPAQLFTNRIIFGQIPTIEKLIPLISLSHSRIDLLPDFSDILTQIALDLDVSNVVIIQSYEQTQLIAQHGNEAVNKLGTTEQLEESISKLQNPTTIWSEGTEFFKWNAWVGMIQPIFSKKRLIGYLCTSHPQTVPRNSKHVKYLENVGSLLGIVLELLILNSLKQQLSERLLEAQWNERDLFSVRLHNSVLHTIGSADAELMNSLNRPDYEVGQEVRESLMSAHEMLKSAKKGIRQVCNGLFPESVNDGLHVVCCQA